jgi:hypothetical protein
LGELLKSAKEKINPSSIQYINTQLKYYNISNNPDSLTDNEWAMSFAILGHIRESEKNKEFESIIS